MQAGHGGRLVGICGWYVGEWSALPCCRLLGLCHQDEVPVAGNALVVRGAWCVVRGATDVRAIGFESGLPNGPPVHISLAAIQCHVLQV
jgi:hypothetical protein